MVLTDRLCFRAFMYPPGSGSRKKPLEVEVAGGGLVAETGPAVLERGLPGGAAGAVTEGGLRSCRWSQRPVRCGRKHGLKTSKTLAVWAPRSVV